jgi:phage terminase large subunit GpA-like protein
MMNEPKVTGKGVETAVDLGDAVGARLGESQVPGREIGSPAGRDPSAGYRSIAGSQPSPLFDIQEHWRKVHEAQLRGLLSKAFEPAEKLNVDEWGERNIVLNPKVTQRATSGPLKLDRRPYLRGPMRAFTEPKYRHILMIFSPQLGKTLVMQTILGYCIDQDPGPAMMAFPGQIMAKNRSNNHIKPLILDSPKLKSHTTGRAKDLQNFDYRLDTMRVMFGWAGSAVILASESIRYLFRDEIDKWKHLNKEESHPLDLAAERISSFDEFGRIIDATTLTTEDGAGWKLLNLSTFHEDWVPCPNCGRPDEMEDVPLLVVDPVDHVDDVDRELTAQERESIKANAWDMGKPFTNHAALLHLQARMIRAGYQVMRFRGITGFKGIKEPLEIQEKAYYECVHCKAHIEHKEVLEMTKQGKWVPRFPERDIAGFWCPTWYRALKKSSFGTVARKWIEAQGDKEKLQRCVTQDLNEPWQELGVQLTEDDIKKNCREYERDEIPFEPLFIFCTVDLRDPEIHYIVRAWGYYETSALLRYAVLPRLQKFKAGDEPTGKTIEILDTIRGMTFRLKGDKSRVYGINLMAIDSGDDADEVYVYCRKHPGTVAMKSEEMTQILQFSRPEKIKGEKEARPDSAFLITWGHEYFADTLVSKMAISRDNPGEWMLPMHTGDDYVQHMLAEKKVEEKTRWGRVKKRWKQSKKNHWLDCERMQIALARVANVADAKPPENKKAAAPSTGNSDMMGRDFSDFTNRLNK